MHLITQSIGSIWAGQATIQVIDSSVKIYVGESVQCFAVNENSIDGFLLKWWITIGLKRWRRNQLSVVDLLEEFIEWAGFQNDDQKRHFLEIAENMEQRCEEHYPNSTNLAGQTYLEVWRQIRKACQQTQPQYY